MARFLVYGGKAAKEDPNYIKAEVYELDGAITSIDFLRNLDKTYDEVSEELDVES